MERRGADRSRAAGRYGGEAMTTAHPYRWLVHFAAEHKSLCEHAAIAKARLRLVRLFFAIRAMNENRDWDSFHRSRNLRTFRKVPRHVRQWSLNAINEVSEADADLHACESGIRYFTQQMLGLEPCCQGSR